MRFIFIIFATNYRLIVVTYHLNPAIAESYVRMLYPEKPRHPRQKYLLTVKGLALLNEMEGEV